MNKLVACLCSIDGSDVLAVEFSDGSCFEYKGFSPVDESIYGDDSYVVAELLSGANAVGLCEFKVDGIIKVKNMTTKEVVYEPSKPAI